MQITHFILCYRYLRHFFSRNYPKSATTMTRLAVAKLVLIFPMLILVVVVMVYWPYSTAIDNSTKSTSAKIGELRNNQPLVVLGPPSEPVECKTGKPCNDYSDDVDFRIIVLTYNRDVSLLKLLNSLQDMELDGDKAAIEIWIDVNSKGEAEEKNVKAAQSFRWKKGPTRVHVQTSHAGIMGQWIDTWRPRPESREIGLILEDDISVSPMAYRWLKAVHKGMKNRTDFVGASLTSDQMSILSSTPKGPLAAPKNDTILMYKCLGTWGFSPKPEHWRRFQDWFHLHKPSVAPRFHPYVPDSLPSAWYRNFEKQGTAQHMWEMWFIHYMHIEQVFCVYNNLGVYTGNKESCLCINRREVGLHVSSKGPENLCKLLTVWRDEFVALPVDVVRLHWNGEPMGNRHFFL